MEYTKEQIRAIRQKLAATYGLVTGVVLSLILCTEYISAQSPKLGFVIGILNIAAVYISLSFATKKFGAKVGPQHFNYSSAYGFIILVMLYAGVIYGSFFFVQLNYIDPEHYADMKRVAVEINRSSSGADKDSALMLLDDMMKNPINVIFSSMFATLLYGAFLGLIVALTATRKKQ